MRLFHKSGKIPESMQFSQISGRGSTTQNHIFLTFVKRYHHGHVLY